MKNTLKFCLEQRNDALRILSQMYSNETISEKTLMAWVFIEVTFKNCQFENVNFDSTVFAECQFDQCLFSRSNLNAAQIRRCNFNNSKFIKSNLTDLEVEQVMFNSCTFNEVSFAASYIENSCFSYSEFENIDERSSSSTIENSKISINNHQSILLDGDFEFYEVLKFLPLA